MTKRLYASWAAVLLLSCAAWAVPLTIFTRSGSTLRIKGATFSPDDNPTGGNAIIMYEAMGATGLDLIFFDFSGLQFNAAGGSCALDPDDSYIHCPAQGLTTIDVQLGQNPQNSLLFQGDAIPVPTVTTLKLTGSNVISGTGDFVTVNGGLFPNLSRIRSDLRAGSPHLQFSQ